MDPIRLFATTLIIPFAVIDARVKRVPNRLLAVEGIVLAAATILFAEEGIAIRILCCACFIAALAAFSILSGGRFGMGDAKLVGFMAFGFGFSGTIVLLSAACVMALAWSIVLKIAKKSGDSRIPFAPFMLAGSLFALFVNPFPSW